MALHAVAVRFVSVRDGVGPAPNGAAPARSDGGSGASADEGGSARGSACGTMDPDSTTTQAGETCGAMDQAKSRRDLVDRVARGEPGGWIETPMPHWNLMVMVTAVAGDVDDKGDVASLKMCIASAINTSVLCGNGLDAGEAKPELMVLFKEVGGELFRVSDDAMLVEQVFDSTSVCVCKLIGVKDARRGVFPKSVGAARRVSRKRRRATFEQRTPGRAGALNFHTPRVTSTTVANAEAKAAFAPAPAPGEEAAEMHSCAGGVDLNESTTPHEPTKKRRRRRRSGKMRDDAAKDAESCAEPLVSLVVQSGPEESAPVAAKVGPELVQEPVQMQQEPDGEMVKSELVAKAAAAHKLQEEAATRKVQEEKEAAVLKTKQEAAALEKAKQAAAARKAREQKEAAAKKAEQEAAALKARQQKEEEEAALEKAKQEAAARKAREQEEEEAALEKAKQEAAALKAREQKEEAAMKKAEQEAAARKAREQEEEEAAVKKAEQEAAARKAREEKEAAVLEKAKQEAAARKAREEKEAAALEKAKQEAVVAAPAKLDEEERPPNAANKRDEEPRMAQQPIGGNTKTVPVIADSDSDEEVSQADPASCAAVNVKAASNGLMKIATGRVTRSKSKPLQVKKHTMAPSEHGASMRFRNIVRAEPYAKDNKNRVARRVSGAK